MSFGFQSKSCKITSLVMQFYLFLRNVTVIIVKSFTCQLQLSIIVGKLHHANCISGRHNGQNLENRGVGNLFKLYQIIIVLDKNKDTIFCHIIFSLSSLFLRKRKSYFLFIIKHSFGKYCYRTI